MPEITDEQRAAVEWLRRTADDRSLRQDLPPAVAHARTILSALPASLTNPQPELPTKPGIYSDKLGQAWQLGEDALWSLAGQEEVEEPNKVRRNAPFTRLVPERPQITAKDVKTAWDEWGSKLSFLDFALRLVNGTDQ